MFCENCGAKLPDGGKFCQECGSPARNVAQVPSESPPAQQENWQQPRQAPSSGSNKGLFIGLGIAALVLLLAGDGFAAYKSGLTDRFKADGEVALGTAEPAQEVGRGAADPIRAGIVSGTGTVASKVDEYQAERVRQLIRGDWYDNSGNKLVTVSDRSINGCEIIAIYDLAGGGGNAAGTFRLQENGRQWDMRLSWRISKTPGDSLAINGSQTLHRNQGAGSEETALETVGGIYLGMTPEQVEHKLGKPTRILDREHPLEVGGNKFVYGWLYAKKNLMVSFSNGSADGIVLLRGCKLRFGKSGLGVDSSLDEYERAYNMSRRPRVPQAPNTVYPSPIGNGQTLFFGMGRDYVWLSVYDT